MGNGWNMEVELPSLNFPHCMYRVEVSYLSLEQAMH